MLVISLSLTFHLLCFLGSLLLKIFFRAVAYDYFIPCLLQALEVSSFSASTSSLVLAVDDAFEEAGAV